MAKAKPWQGFYFLDVYLLPLAVVLWCRADAAQCCQRFKLPVMLSDSDKAGSRAGLEPESATIRPRCHHAPGSASNMAGHGGAGKLQFLPFLYRGKTNK